MKPWQLHGVTCLILAGVTCACMGRVVGCRFINLDDPTYVTMNPQVIGGLTPENVRWAWATNYAAFWIPLTWLSFQLDATLYWPTDTWYSGANAAAWGFHLHNLILHVANSLLVYALIYRCSASWGCSAMVAGLFGVHPLHVESVAWVTERKDVLSGFFGLLALLVYLHYQDRPSILRMLGVAVLFALSLMAKPVMVTLPAVMLLLDWWRGRLRWRALLWIVAEKLPLFGLSLACTAVTVWAHSSVGSVAGLDQLTVYVRYANAVISYRDYVAKTFWPVDLAVFYPHPVLLPGADNVDPLSLANALTATALLAGITVLAALPIFTRTRNLVPLMGWLWFVGALLPNIGLVQAGNQGMADRFCYFALIGLFLSLVSAGAEIAWLLRLPRGLMVALSACILLVLAGFTWVQVGYWYDSVTLYEHALAVTENNGYIHGFLAYEQYDRQQNAAAEKNFEIWSAHHGAFPQFHARYGDLLLRRAFHSEPRDYELMKKAGLHLQYALEHDGTLVDAHLNFARVLLEVGRKENDRDMLANARKVAAAGLGRTQDPSMREQFQNILEELGSP